MPAPIIPPDCDVFSKGFSMADFGRVGRRELGCSFGTVKPGRSLALSWANDGVSDVTTRSDVNEKISFIADYLE